MNKVTVYSGDDIVSSRKAFLEHIEGLRNDNLEVNKVLGKDLTSESLELLFAPSSLFGQKRVLVIENLLSGQKSKEKEKITEYLSGSENEIVIWESKEFTKADQQKHPANFVFKNFKLPPMLFNFLGNLSPGKTKANLDSFHKVIKEVDPTFVFLMLARQLRYLILASEDELSGMPSWQSSKLFRQAKLFKKENLLAIYERLLEIDYKQKTSQMVKDLVYELDLLLADI